MNSMNINGFGSGISGDIEGDLRFERVQTETFFLILLL